MELVYLKAFQIVRKPNMFRYVIIVKLFELPLLSADNLCKQLGPRSKPNKMSFLRWTTASDTLMVFLKDFFKKLILNKTLDNKNVSKITSMYS